MNKYNSIIIIGPTASGKTGLSVELAKVLNGEVINADSTQVYKQLNIGTAKATKTEMQGVKHHLIGFLNPKKEFNVSLFKTKATKVIKKLFKKNVMPIIVGGTGLYVNSLINNYNYATIKKDEKIREKYASLAKLGGNLEVYNELKKIDPITAQKLHPNDIGRVVRALEIYELTGIPKSQHDNDINNILDNVALSDSTMQTNNTNTMQDSEFNAQTSNFKNAQNAIFGLNPLIIGLTMDREKLYNKINLRTDIMINNGLLDEVKKLYNKKYSSSLQSIKSIGYKELYEHFDGNLSLEEAKELIQKNTRNYAKRQLTWFNKMKNIVWFDASKEDLESIVQRIMKLYNS